MPCPIVFIDFAGPDDDALRDFYSTVFDWTMDDAGKFTTPAATSCTI